MYPLNALAAIRSQHLAGRIVTSVDVLGLLRTPMPRIEVPLAARQYWFGGLRSAVAHSSIGNTWSTYEYLFVRYRLSGVRTTRIGSLTCAPRKPEFTGAHATGHASLPA